jgi:RNA polymerase sigma-70 factor (ECF subfamily)
MIDQVAELCQSAKAGDAVAASELVSLFYERVYAYFRRLCGNDEDAEDLTQKTFVKVWAALGSFQGRSSFSTWIHGVGHHVYVDWRRTRQRSDIQTDEWWETCLAEGPSPFEDVVEQELARQLYAMVQQLEEGAKEAVHLHYYQGLSLKETAEVLNIATSTVKYRLREALASLRARAAEPKLRETL